MLPPMARGEHKACFAVTEPNTGLNTTQLKLRALRRGDRYVVDGRKIWTSTAQSAAKILLLARTTPIHSLRNIWRLLMYRIQNGASLEIKSVFGIGVSDVADHVSHQFPDIDIGLRRNFPAHDDQTDRNEGLTGNASSRILR